MDLSKLENILVVLSTDAATDERFKNGPLYQQVSKCEAELTQTTVNNIATLNDNFDAILTIEQNFNTPQLEQLFKLLKPNSNLVIQKLDVVKNLVFLLKVNGFVVESGHAEMIVAKKPEYEVGSAVPLTKKVWALDDDLIDDNELLDEADKVKPSAEELRVCASTKQRKACANCSCGLKEELEQEEIQKIRENSQNVKSSCGNCYLGDAFRCASCPYRGMPAFKPGEKVVIDNTDDL